MAHQLSPFMILLRKYLDMLDNGQFFGEPFKWLYILLAGLNILAPVWFFSELMRLGLFDLPFRMTLSLILVWVILLACCVLGFLIWWNRKNDIPRFSGTNGGFVVTPVFAHFIKTFGEWCGTLIAILGFFAALVSNTLLPSDYSLEYYLPVPALDIGFPGIVIMPIIGYLIISTLTFLSEQVRALAAIANDVKHLAYRQKDTSVTTTADSNTVPRADPKE